MFCVKKHSLNELNGMISDILWGEIITLIAMNNELMELKEIHGHIPECKELEKLPHDKQELSKKTMEMTLKATFLAKSISFHAGSREKLITIDDPVILETIDNFAQAAEKIFQRKDDDGNNNE